MKIQTKIFVALFALLFSTTLLISCSSAQTTNNAGGLIPEKSEWKVNSKTDPINGKVTANLTWGRLFKEEKTAASVLVYPCKEQNVFFSYLPDFVLANPSTPNGNVYARYGFHDGVERKIAVAKDLRLRNSAFTINADSAIGLIKQMTKHEAMVVGLPNLKGPEIFIDIKLSNFKEALTKAVTLCGINEEDSPF